MSFEDAMNAMFGDEPRTRPPLPPDFLKTDEEMEKLCGEQFATGTSRNAHEVIGNPDAVMKKVHLPSPAANYCEQLIWSSLQGTELEKDFGQILGISHSGKYLMMERLSDITVTRIDVSCASDSFAARGIADRIALFGHC